MEECHFQLACPAFAGSFRSRLGGREIFFQLFLYSGSATGIFDERCHIEWTGLPENVFAGLVTSVQSADTYPSQGQIDLFNE